MFFLFKTFWKAKHFGKFKTKPKDLLNRQKPRCAENKASWEIPNGVFKNIYIHFQLFFYFIFNFRVLTFNFIQ